MIDSLQRKLRVSLEELSMNKSKQSTNVFVYLAGKWTVSVLSWSLIRTFLCLRNKVVAGLYRWLVVSLFTFVNATTCYTCVRKCEWVSAQVRGAAAQLVFYTFANCTVEFVSLIVLSRHGCTIVIFELQGRHFFPSFGEILTGIIFGTKVVGRQSRGSKEKP